MIFDRAEVDVDAERAAANRRAVLAAEVDALGRELAGVRARADRAAGDLERAEAVVAGPGAADPAAQIRVVELRAAHGRLVARATHIEAELDARRKEKR